MRIAFATVVALALLTLPAASAYRAPMHESVPALGIARVGTDAVLVWAPAPGAVHYIVSRGLAPDDLAEVGRTSATAFVDMGAPKDVSLYYQVQSVHLNGETHTMSMRVDPYTVSSGTKGECAYVSSSLSFHLTLQNCVRT